MPPTTLTRWFEFRTAFDHPERPVNLGLVIENRASPMAQKYRDKVLAQGPLSWDVSDLGETPDDHLYVWLDHTEMYYRFDVTGPEILHFFEHGRFSPTAQRAPIARDVLEATR